MIFALLFAAASISESELPSGVSLLHVERKAPFAAFAIALPLESALAAYVLEEKIESREHNDVPRAFEKMGAMVQVEHGFSMTVLHGGAPADRFEDAMDLIFGTLSEMTVSQSTVDAAFERWLGARRAFAADPLELAREEAKNALYGRKSGPAEKAATSAIEAELRARIKAKSIVLGISGDKSLSARAAEWTAKLPAGVVEQTRLLPAKSRGKRVIVVDRPEESLVLFARVLQRPSEERLPALLAAASSLDVLGASAELDPALGFSSIALWPGKALVKTTKSALGVLDKARHGPSIEAIALGRKKAATRADVALADPSTHALSVTAAKAQGRSAASVEALAARILASEDAEVASAARILSSGDDLAIVVVASATQELVRELAGIPGVRDVSIVSSGER